MNWSARLRLMLLAPFLLFGLVMARGSLTGMATGARGELSLLSILGFLLVLLSLGLGLLEAEHHYQKERRREEEKGKRRIDAL